MMKLFPNLCQNLPTTPISSKANENFFALVREQITTPDTLEFCMLFPNIVEELHKKSSTLPFVYFTGKKEYYDNASGYMSWSEIPKIDKTPAKTITDEEKNLIEDWRKSFVQSVRQITIRQQTTKSNSGTLPIFAYGTKQSNLSDLDFIDVFGGGISEDVNQAMPILYSKHMVCILKDSDTSIVVLKEDIVQGQGTVNVSVYKFLSDPLNAE